MSSDNRLNAKALSERWPMKPEYRKAIVQSMLMILADPNASNREKTAAARALIAADSINIKEESLLQDDEHDRRLRLLELAKRIPASELTQLASRNGITAESGFIEQRQEEE